MTNQAGRPAGLVVEPFQPASARVLASTFAIDTAAVIGLSSLNAACGGAAAEAMGQEPTDLRLRGRDARTAGWASRPPRPATNTTSHGAGWLVLARSLFVMADPT